MSKKTFAVWDIGATKCAAAIVHYDVNTDRLDCVARCRIKLKDCQSLDELLERVESELQFKTANADAICIAAAGRYNGKYIELEKGYPYPMDFGRIAKLHQWTNFAIVHDYVPVACATFTKYVTEPGNAIILNKGKVVPFSRRVVFGIGTGLGLKDIVHLPNGDFWLGSNEAGHIGLPFPPTAKKEHQQRHQEFIKFLRSDGLKEDDPIVFETILSGKGLSRTYHFITGETEATPEEISESIHAGNHPEVLKMMSYYLGLFIGTIQLTFMPRGGIWFTGGVVLKNMSLCDQSDMFEGIHASPAYEHVRKDFPLSVMCGPDYAFLGCAYYAKKRMLSALYAE
ncbi:MAG: glucokinase [Gammaproteobacteria bacterium]